MSLVFTQLDLCWPLEVRVMYNKMMALRKRSVSVASQSNVMLERMSSLPSWNLNRFSLHQKIKALNKQAINFQNRASLIEESLFANILMVRFRI